MEEVLRIVLALVITFLIMGLFMLILAAVVLLIIFVFIKLYIRKEDKRYIETVEVNMNDLLKEIEKDAKGVAKKYKYKKIILTLNLKDGELLGKSLVTFDTNDKKYYVDICFFNENDDFDLDIIKEKGDIIVKCKGLHHCLKDKEDRMFSLYVEKYSLIK